MCKEFGTSPKKLNMGHSILTKSGFITHDVHCIYEDDYGREIIGRR